MVQVLENNCPSFEKQRSKFWENILNALEVGDFIFDVLEILSTLPINTCFYMVVQKFRSTNLKTGF